MLDLAADDDPGFIRACRQILAGVLREQRPAELHVVKIDGWFGHRWLGFSYKLLGAVGVHTLVDYPVPPFVPNRVVSHRFFRRDARGELHDAPPPLVLHIEQTSADNQFRRLRRLCPGAALCWWSGDTQRFGRGSLMVYTPSREGHVGWHADLERSLDWRPARTLNITTDALRAYAANAS